MALLEIRMAFYDKHATSNSIDHTADIMLNATQLTDVNIEQISFHNSDLSDIKDYTNYFYQSSF